MGKIEKIENVDVQKLIPYANNAKIHGKKQLEKLKKSIEEFGFLTPCLIDQDFNIIAGHGRVMAAKELKLKEVPCVFVEGLTDSQRRAYILADNRLGELGEWDLDLVEAELEQLADEDFDIDLTGFELDLSFEDDSSEAGAADDEFSDIEKLEKHYGVPYQGNKSRIADRIISVLPAGKRLVDLFGGGVRLPTAQCFQINGIPSCITISIRKSLSCLSMRPMEDLKMRIVLLPGRNFLI